MLTENRATFVLSLATAALLLGKPPLWLILGLAVAWIANVWWFNREA